MKLAVCFAVLLVILSLAVADDLGHDKAIGVEVSLLKGVMTRGADRWSFELSPETKVLISFSWDDEGYREEPVYSLDNRVADVRLKKIKLADRCQLDLELTAKTCGATRLNFAVDDHHSFLCFTVR